MSDYISREELKTFFGGSDFAREFPSLSKVVNEIFNYIPSADVRENIKGKWIDSNIPNEKHVCSVCGGACWYYDYKGYVAKSDFCPNCGADMRGGE